jgi:hypothetical protein
MDLLTRMRDEVPEPAPDALSRAQARLDEALRARPARVWPRLAPPRLALPRLAVRVGIAASLVAALAVTGVVVARESRSGSPRQEAARTGTNDLLLVAATTKRAGSFRFHATDTSELDATQIRGIWDPVGPKGDVFVYQKGRLISEQRINGSDSAVRIPGRPWQHSPTMLHDDTDDTIVPRPFINGPYSSSKGWSSVAPATFEPGELLKDLVDGGATTRDLGVSGHGADAVRTFSFRVVLPNLPLHNAAHVETGTIAVGVASGLITKIAWSQPLVGGWPDRIVTDSSTLEYSDYGLPVDVRIP